MEKEYQKIPRFVPDTCRNCKGHGVYMLDCDFTEKEDRDLLTKVISNYEK
jgi:hypothetical protein